MIESLGQPRLSHVLTGFTGLYILSLGMALNTHFAEVIKYYWSLGLISFGGPGVHVVILRKRFVDKLKWIDITTFLDLFTLGNALPGPGSTQLAFSIAVVTHGVLPGLLAFTLWALPGALMMTGVAVAISHIPASLPPPVLALLTGLNAAAVGLIALAALQLASNAATDRVTLLLLWVSASFGICYHAPWMYPTLICASGVATFAWDFRRVWIIAPMRKLRDRSREAEHIGMDRLEPQSDTPNNQLGFASDENDPSSNRQDALNVVSIRVAVTLIAGFALLLAVPLGVRAGLQRAGKGVPRTLDVSTSIPSTF
jgi:chromate transport protein ChrA